MLAVPLESMSSGYMASTAGLVSHFAGTGFGDENDNSLKLLFHIAAATPSEGLPVPICVAPGWIIPGAQYVVRASIQQTGEFQGTLNLECYWDSNGTMATQPIIFDTQPIRRL